MRKQSLKFAQQMCMNFAAHKCINNALNMNQFMHLYAHNKCAEISALCRGYTVCIYPWLTFKIHAGLRVSIIVNWQLPTSS